MKHLSLDFSRTLFLNGPLKHSHVFGSSQMSTSENVHVLMEESSAVHQQLSVDIDNNVSHIIYILNVISELMFKIIHHYV